jgi:hypothetical protein
MDRFVELLRPLEARAQISMALARRFEGDSATGPKTPRQAKAGMENEADFQATWRTKG